MVLKGKGVCVPRVAAEELALELLLRMRLGCEMSVVTQIRVNKYTKQALH